MKSIFAILAILLMISGQASSSMTFLTADATKCPIFSCEDIKGVNCAAATGTMAAGRKVKINPCNDATPVCSYKSSDFVLDQDITSNCSVSVQALPGETCTITADCATVQRWDKDAFKPFQECDVTITNKVCKGGLLDEKCKDDKTCMAGMYCDISSGVEDQYKCKTQLTETTKCTRTYECANNLICLNAKCTQPFSLADGADVSTVEGAFLRYACKSGYYHDANKKCASLKYVDTTGIENGVLKCNYGDKCKYTANFDATTAAIPFEQTCVCGYNGNQQGYCPYASQDPSTSNHFENLVSLKKANLSNKLHTQKRLQGQTDGSKGGPLCYPYYESTSFYNAVSCAKKILGQGACNYIDPQKCPKFSFDATKGANCVNASNLMIYNRTVKVNSCNGEVPNCNYDPTKFTSDDNYTANCNAIAPAPYAYPGEACKANTDCIAVNKWNDTKKTFEPIQVCTNSLCEGSAVGARCDNTNQCIAGNYCNKADADQSKWSCQPQLKVGDACKSTFDCQNSMICLNSKCAAAFSQLVGFDLTTVDADGINSTCKSGYYSSKNKKCATIDYKTGSTIDDKGIVKCNFEDNCNYTLTIDAQTPPATEELTQKCQCGYNSDGQGYCPFGFHNSKISQHFTNLVNLKIKNLSNTNHSLSRGAGSDKSSVASPLCYPYYENAAFYGAQPEIVNVLGKMGTCGDIDKSSSSDTSTPSSSSSSSSIRLSILSLIMLLFVLN